MIATTTVRSCRIRRHLSVALAALLTSVGACRTADLLSVPTPAGVGTGGGGDGALALVSGATGLFSIAYGANGGQVDNPAMLGDELANAFADCCLIPIDARNASVHVGTFLPGQYVTDGLYVALQKARLNARQAALAISGTRPVGWQAAAGRVDALGGFAMMFLAEDFCAGVPLGTILPGGGVSQGVPLTTDSLLGVAITAFDSALAVAPAGDSAQFIAALGLGRAFMDRGRYAAAKAAVAAVPTGFTAAVALSTAAASNAESFYTRLIGFPIRTVPDRKGIVGMNYISAADPRMPIDSTLGQTFLGTTLYYPAKFPVGSGSIPFAQGIEARLIEAEAALQAGDVTGWANTLDALRADSAETGVGGLAPLTADSTTLASATARVDVMFRERAFWLYGTGRRLGDMRRLVRQYGRDQSTVFPSGSYPLYGMAQAAPAQYGVDVNFPIVAVERQNSNFHGCIDRTA